MRKGHAYTLRQLRQIRDYLGRTKVEVAVGNLATQRAQLDAYIARLERLADERATRDRSSRLRTAAARGLARRLRQSYIKPIVRAAQALPTVTHDAERAVLMPAKVRYEQLAVVANDLAVLVERNQEAFAGAGFAPENAVRMREVAAELLAEVGLRAAEISGRVASIEGAKDEVRLARKLVRVLDAMVVPSLESAPGEAAEWRSVARFAMPTATAKVADPVTPAGELKAA